MTREVLPSYPPTLPWYYPPTLLPPHGTMLPSSYPTVGQRYYALTLLWWYYALTLPWWYYGTYPHSGTVLIPCVPYGMPSSMPPILLRMHFGFPYMTCEVPSSYPPTEFWSYGPMVRYAMSGTDSGYAPTGPCGCGARMD
eukprot:2528162-Rhodomonas_salina.1